jgi:hypothetical protein
MSISSISSTAVAPAISAAAIGQSASATSGLAGVVQQVKPPHHHHGGGHGPSTKPTGAAPTSSTSFVNTLA